MKTTIKAKIIIETDKYCGFGIESNAKDEISLANIKQQINNGHYVIEWINNELQPESEPTLIIKI